MSLQFNEELNDYQAMVALEVIEHLPEDTLQRFGAIILGEYRPSLLLVTTPSQSDRLGTRNDPPFVRRVAHHCASSLPVHGAQTTTSISDLIARARSRKGGRTRRGGRIACSGQSRVSGRVASRRWDQELT